MARVATPSGLPGGLPFYATSFLGRNEDLASFRARFEANRLVTVTGAGGAGKTRLAVEFIRQQSLPAIFVALDHVTDAAMVWTAVADAAGLQRHPNADVRDIALDALAAGRRLVVLDNCEHLRLAAAELTRDLLASCPEVRIVATSREPLGLPGEDVLILKPLPTPSVVGEALATDVTACPSLQLFYERAATRAADLSPTPLNAGPAVRLCDLLDGIPLAIELAAGWAHAFTVEEILEFVSSQAGVLRTSDPFAPERHATLAATIEWSARLLDPEELRLLLSLAVFSGGASLDAISSICLTEASDAALHPRLARLVGASLVIADNSGVETRYRLLEPIRQWCLERLEPDVQTTLRRRHAAFFAAFAEEADQRLRSARQLRARDDVDRELANLRSALKWATENDPESGAALRIASGLAFYWPIKGRILEGRRWIENALATYPHRDAIRARGLTEAALLTWRGEDYEVGLRLAEEAVEIAQDCEDELLAAIALTWVAMLNERLGRVTEARSAIAHAEPVLQARGARHHVGRCHTARTLCHLRMNEKDAARVAAGAGLEVSRTVGDRVQMSGFYDMLAETEPDAESAYALHREALVLRREMGDIPALCESLFLLSLTRLDHPAEMAPMVEEGLIITEEQADRTRAGLLLLVLAQAAHPVHPEPARLVAGQGLALLGAAVARLAPDDQEFVSSVQNILRPVEPHQSSIGEAVRGGRELAQLLLHAPTGPEEFRNPHRLTPREIQVLGLIAAGYTNAEIAGHLSASIRTVERHISNLYGKIGARGKADATTYAFREGLVPPA